MSKQNKNDFLTQMMQDIKSIGWKDPIVVLLCILLIFLTAGSTLSACSGNRKSVIKITLDAAFGGEDTGYEGIMNEAEATEKIVVQLQELLKNDGNFQVSLTHETKETLSVKERAVKVNEEHPQYVLSIHADGSPNAELNGTRVYANIPSSKYNEVSLRFAKQVASAFSSEDKTVDPQYLYYQPYEDTETYEMKYVSTDDTTDYKLDTWELMKQCNAPVVIVNAFYVTSQTDVETWNTDEGYKKIADNLYTAICKDNGLERK